MYKYRWFFHPLLIFALSIVALGTSLILYIYWYIEVSAGLKGVVNKFNLDPEQILTVQTWVVILVLSLLVGVILMGMLTIFVYSQKMVQLYRFQRNFINNFTHELKTPVTSISIYLETFRKYELTRDDQLKYIDYMLSDVKRLSDNISRILNLARIENKSYTTEFAWLDPVETIERFLAKNRHLFTNCQIRLKNHADRTFYCFLNPSLFEILLMNLLINAAKYNTSETPQIDIDVRPGTGSLALEFKDNGIGFDKGERKKIFKKFYQVARWDDVSAEGSGIGLYLAQSIAKIHKGRIVAASPGLGRGAVFTVTLPIPKRQAG
jgi:two-component system phosphate regulon sensor histidine kinase PhoR